jgi:lipopolysaccharide transport system ATP-binding protein
MSGKVVIQVENLSKQYRLGSIGGATLREDLGRWWAKKRGKPDPWAKIGSDNARAHTEGAAFWALRDVSFEVREGEVLGVIGRNGAGKSTLLKILSRITSPTSGCATIRGRVGSLLEVGTGFHPELTGRENVYLNGAILGMTRAEITRKLEEIVEFAEMAKFIDTPVKRYSSGMTVRLAFAVAAHLEPEILIVDEVLAVGDLSFQRKCIGKMKDVAGHGRTVLFVSHNMNAVISLCSRCILLEGGRLGREGDTEAVVQAYRDVSRVHGLERTWPDLDAAPGNEHFKLARIAVRVPDGGDETAPTVTTGFDIVIDYWNRKDQALLNLSLLVRNQDDVIVFNAIPLTDDTWWGRPHPEGLYRATCRVLPRMINSGTHSIELLAVHNQARVVFALPDALVFDVGEVAEPGTAWFGRFPGTFRPHFPWTTELLKQGHAR